MGWVGVNQKLSKIGPGSCGVGGAQPEVVYDWSGGHVRWVGVNRKWSGISSGGHVVMVWGQPEVVHDLSGSHVYLVEVNWKWSGRSQGHL